MYDDNVYARHHRGSSPPYQSNTNRRLEDWMRSCRSIDQHTYNLSDIETLRQLAVPKIELPIGRLNDNFLSDGESTGNDKI